jgi:hypothetical protein
VSHDRIPIVQRINRIPSRITRVSSRSFDSRQEVSQVKKQRTTHIKCNVISIVLQKNVERVPRAAVYLVSLFA